MMVSPSVSTDEIAKAELSFPGDHLSTIRHDLLTANEDDLLLDSLKGDRYVVGHGPTMPSPLIRVKAIDR